ncbi:carbohydrate ABC transporter permease [Bosea sp. (in: a-proteobacteria)]|uniref:carbohydrate ABC transporter permease n=1 Tax=Bosea sp. (in: a-proteobacteria) TaxID=1871050 RepID=UPI00261DA018|nr:carbohydrate ABC transporter permease [Bosea sp. (in: a-proteobacteria)]MCO5090992.1 carbohydrate ABC transporter permease [Bosea sp. (in: a-proteobacteria)]
MDATRKRRWALPDRWSVLVVLAFALLAVLNLMPLIWGVLTSFKSPPDLFRFPPTLFGFTPTLENYQRVIESGFLGNMRVSLFYSGTTVAATLVLALPAAYAFDRFDFPLRQPLFMLVVASIPLSLGAAALLIPNYLYFSRLGLTNAWYTLPLILTAHQLPMAIWIMKGTIEGIPRELDEAAVADGASHFEVLRFVILPLTKPAFGAAGVLTFVASWNEFVAGSVMVDSPALRPIQPAIYNFIGFFGREWGPLTASATLAILPILIAFALLGRLIVSGLTKGSVKG